MSITSKHIKRIGFYVSIAVIAVVLLLLHRCGGNRRELQPKPLRVSPITSISTDTSRKTFSRDNITASETVYIQKPVYIHDTVKMVTPRVDTVILYSSVKKQYSPAITGLVEAEHIEQIPINNQISLENRKLAKDTLTAISNTEKKHYFNLKLNLLALPMTIVNAELEVPLSEHISVSAEWLGTWWWNASQFRGLHFAGGAIEGRYWLSDQIKYEKLSGFFVGINAGGGIYDILYNSKGYKGDYYTAGLTAGFAHSIGRDLCMEYSLGLGYISSSYEYFTSSTPNVNPWSYDAKFSLFGPTRARIALVWYF